MDRTPHRRASYPNAHPKRIELEASSLLANEQRSPSSFPIAASISPQPLGTSSDP
ncbi:hypothetical protein [Tumidithrix elongata]|uniref:hypothetical protein n=1 Tax=Tumidithrix elongata TaxID=3088357 RepID=UPI002ED40EAF